MSLEVRTSFQGMQERAVSSQDTMLNIEDSVQQSTSLLSATATKSDVAEMKMMMLAMMSDDAREVFQAMVSKQNVWRALHDDTTAAPVSEASFNGQYPTSIQSKLASRICPQFDCRCNRSRTSKRRKRRFGPAFFEQETVIDTTHLLGCPFSGFDAYSRSSWTAGMSMKVFQVLVSTAIKVSKSGFSGRGLKVSSSLSVYNTRKTSPVREILRVLSSACCYTWHSTDDEVTALALQGLEAIKKSFSEGKSSPFDLDEYGNTLLHIQCQSSRPIWAELWGLVFSFLVKANVPRDRPNNSGRYLHRFLAMFQSLNDAGFHFTQLSMECGLETDRPKHYCST